MPFQKPSLTWVVTLISGGLAGAVFTYFVNRPKTTVISYSLTYATIADTQSGSIVRDLRVQIGNQDIHNLYTHSVVMSVAKGPQIDSGEVAIAFSPGVKLYGDPSIGTPSPVHKLVCRKTDFGLLCTMSPVRKEDRLPPFRVTVATDEKGEPELVTSTKGLELQPAQETLKSEARTVLTLQLSIAVFLAGCLAIFAQFLRGARRERASWEGKLSEQNASWAGKLSEERAHWDSELTKKELELHRAERELRELEDAIKIMRRGFDIKERP